MTDASRVSQMLPRETASAADQFLNLIANPFQTSIKTNAFLASLTTSLGISAIVALLFCLLRPYNTVVYAPRLKHADEKHAPPPIGKGVFAWVTPVVKTKEQLFAEKVGLDATVFLRFSKMCRNIFLILTVLGCGILVPVNVVGSNDFLKNFSSGSTTDALMKMTPMYVTYGTQIWWAYVGSAYVVDLVMCFFLWWNYRAITRLRRAYFESPEYQGSLHARTLMLTDIPKSLRSDEGIVRIADEIKTTPSVPRAAIARNVKILPELIKEHEKAVRSLEEHLAKYLKNPDKLPEKRPTCKPSKKDKSYSNSAQEVDAIDYLTTRIQNLEIEIRQIRESVDQRNAMSYGFASYDSIDEAHNVAYAARHKHPHGAKVRLAPKPNDILWDNLPLDKHARRWKTIYNNLWVALLTVGWIAPNVLIAVFLSNLSNLGLIWHSFQNELIRHPTTWAIVQGVVAPAITSLFYFFLPPIFRRLSMKAGDLTKTSRERHVTHKLYAFFVFNNLVVFSVFAAVWVFVSAVISARNDPDESIWKAIEDAKLTEKVTQALCSVSPFWVAWLLQRNLGAAIDLVQLANLAWGSFSRKFLSPTPRQLIELTAPPPFDYASYYNYFLFYTTVALTFGALQPLVFPVTALYFTLDSWLKKYLLMYVFITKTESGGQFWRMLFNRCIFAAFFSNCIVALLVKARGANWNMVIAMIPLPIILVSFKWWCRLAFDDAQHFYSKGERKNPEAVIPIDKQSRRKDRVGVRFGHPALYRPLMVPMVHAKAKHLLSQIYRGRLNSDVDGASVAGYSDTYSMHHMSRRHPGKAATPTAPFEIVQESQLDFENFKDRPEFREEFGGEGELFGKPPDRVGTPTSFATQDRQRSSSRDSQKTYTTDADAPGTIYPPGYHKTPVLRSDSPDSRSFSQGHYHAPETEANLLRDAAPMGLATPGIAPGSSHMPSSTPGSEDETSYDYFRRGRQR